jgi:hypothetical protein
MRSVGYLTTLPRLHGFEEEEDGDQVKDGMVRIVKEAIMV